MRKALALALLLIASPVLAENPKTLSLTRLSAGVTVGGITVNQGPIDFLPTLNVSYSLTSQMSAAGNVGHDPTHGGTISTAGLRAKIGHFGDGDLGFGASYIRYDGAYTPGHPESWIASVNGSWPVAFSGTEPTRKPVLWLSGAGERDGKNDRTMFRLGLRYRFLGGKRVVETE